MAELWLRLRLNGETVHEERLRPGQRRRVGGEASDDIGLPGHSLLLFAEGRVWQAGEARLAEGESLRLQAGVMELHLVHSPAFRPERPWGAHLDGRLVAALLLCLGLAAYVDAARAGDETMAPTPSPYLRYLAEHRDGASRFDEAGAAQAAYTAGDFAAAVAAQGGRDPRSIEALRARRRAGLALPTEVADGALERAEAALWALDHGDPDAGARLLDEALAAGLPDGPADRIEAQLLARRGDLPTARQRLTAAIRAWDRQLPAEQQELFFDLALAPSLEALRQDGSIEQILRLHGLAQDPLTAVGFLPRP